MGADAVSTISTYFRVCDGVRVRFADNKADSDITVLLLAPWPESLWAFRRIWDRVAALGRVVAIDLPGFGHSDGRPELIAPDSSGAFLARLIDEWDLGAPHVVGPDVGTAAALFLAAKAPGTRHEPDHRRRRGPLPDRSGRRAQGHHRSAEPGRGARAGRPNQHRRRGRGRALRAPPNPTSTRTTSAPTTSDASRSRRGSCGTTPSRTRCCVTCCRRSRHRPRSWPAATMTSCPGRTTSTSTTSFPTARSIRSTPDTSPGNKHRTSTVDLSLTGSAAGIGASVAARPLRGCEECRP